MTLISIGDVPSAELSPSLISCNREGVLDAGLLHRVDLIVWVAHGARYSFGMSDRSLMRVDSRTGTRNFRAMRSPRRPSTGNARLWRVATRIST
jgi:hypothetical protein